MIDYQACGCRRACQPYSPKMQVRRRMELEGRLGALNDRTHKQIRLVRVLVISGCHLPRRRNMTHGAGKRRPNACQRNQTPKEEKEHGHKAASIPQYHHETNQTAAPPSRRERGIGYLALKRFPAHRYLSWDAVNAPSQAGIMRHFRRRRSRCHLHYRVADGTL